jgi:hypothetical protein
MKRTLVALAALPPVIVLAASFAARPRPPAPAIVAEPAPAPAPVPAADRVPARVERPSPAPAPTAATPPMATRAGSASLAARSPSPPPGPRRCPPSIAAVDPREVDRTLRRCPRLPRDTPLVLSFDGAPVELVADAAHSFDLNGAESRVTDWPAARTPWLALDRDGDGRIGDGSELFGSMTVLSSGARAPDGFAALRELDADGDGRLTPADPAFAGLVLWADRDGDRRSSPDEIAPLSAYEILSIDLDDHVETRCDARGNCEVERASFQYRDAAGVVRTGAVVDVHLAAQR